MPELLTVSRAARNAIAAVEHQFGDRALQHAFPEAPARAP